jgi:L-lactate dehydrogenase (cytochrome)
MGEVVAQSCATPKFFQLYVNKDRAKTEAILKQAQTHGFNAVLLTIDGPVPGKREADERIISNIRISSAMSEVASSNDSKGGGLTRSTGRYIDSSLEWNDLKWLRSLTDMPLILKGVQGALDAKIAMQHGITGIVISNHGGRNLDTYVEPHYPLSRMSKSPSR